MKIKTIFWIVAGIVMLQVLPLYASLFSEAFKLELTADAFGPNMSEDALLMFEFFALVVGLTGTGVVFALIGATSFKDEAVLRRMSFLFFVILGFFALPDLISFLKGDPTAPLPVVLLGLSSLVLLFYGTKKGKV
ncbi:MAG: hypothetical protein ACPHXR_06295 [Flavicella sp.]